MLPFTHVVNLFADKFPRLRAGSFAFTSILPRPLNGPLFRHLVSFHCKLHKGRLRRIFCLNHPRETVGKGRTNRNLGGTRRIPKPGRMSGLRKALHQPACE